MGITQIIRDGERPLRSNGYGSADLYISFPEDASWTKPKNLGPLINTNAREYSPRVSADGKWLYYAGEKGFLNEKREKPIDHAEFVEKSRGIMNGLGNIYRVPMEAVLRNARAANAMGVLPEPSAGDDSATKKRGF